jgi:DNA-binding response OmpR family regulator
LAETGKEGVRMATQYNPDLILLDIGLPDVNGHAVLQELRLWYDKPVIILSVQNGKMTSSMRWTMELQIIYPNHFEQENC